MEKKQPTTILNIPLSVLLMSLLYILAGVNHFSNPEWYLKIMPTYVPYHLPLVYISGVAEFILGVLLLSQATRKLSGYSIILLLIAIYPANIQMMLDYYRSGNPYLWIAILRLPLQFILIWWAWKCANLNVDSRHPVTS